MIFAFNKHNDIFNALSLEHQQITQQWMRASIQFQKLKWLESTLFFSFIYDRDVIQQMKDGLQKQITMLGNQLQKKEATLERAAYSGPSPFGS
jgi:hypothetical protein